MTCMPADEGEPQIMRGPFHHLASDSSENSKVSGGASASASAGAGGEGGDHAGAAGANKNKERKTPRVVVVARTHDQLEHWVHE